MNENVHSASDHNDLIHLKHCVRAGTVRIIQIKVVGSILKTFTTHMRNRFCRQRSDRYVIKIS